MRHNEDGLRQLTRKNAAMLRSGKARSLGPAETLFMRWAGRSDASRGLPCQAEDEVWISPRMRQEQDRFAEFTDRTWGALQIAAAPSYTRMGALCDRLQEILSELDGLRRDRQERDRSRGSLSDRRHGEENLSESQVQSRRRREEAKKSAPLGARIRSLEEEAANLRGALSALLHDVKEANHVTRLICERVMHHSLQRMDVYWNSAYAHHPKAGQMPAVPQITLIPVAEETYFTQHEPLLTRAQAVLDAVPAGPAHLPDKEVA